MKRKSISDSQSVENISDLILRSKVQPAQANVSTAKTVVVLWIVQDQFRVSCLQFTIILICMIPNSAKAIKDDKKYNLFTNSNTTPP